MIPFNPSNLPSGCTNADIDRNAGGDGEECGLCQGRGYIWIEDPVWHEGDIEVECPRCKGEGRV
jgi:DnaJ-class molecular chaperone